MSKALSPSFVCCYGLARVARVWKISRASVYRSLKETPPNTITRHPGPVGACSDAELVMSRCLLNIAKRSLLRLMLSCVGLASKHAAG